MLNQFAPYSYREFIFGTNEYKIANNQGSASNKSQLLLEKEKLKAKELAEKAAKEKDLNNGRQNNKNN